MNKIHSMGHAPRRLSRTFRASSVRGVMNHDDDLSDIRRQDRQGEMQGQRLSPLLFNGVLFAKPYVV
jgi:hypothetical protein